MPRKLKPNMSTMLTLTMLFICSSLSQIGLASDVRVVRYSKQDLIQPSEEQFIRPQSVAERVISKFKEIMTTATARQSGNNSALRDLALSSSELSKRDWMKKMASLSFDPDSHHSGFDEGMMKQAILSQGKKAAEITLKNDFPVFQQFQKGLTFNLNFGDEGRKKSTKIRYGLIEREIIPSERPIQLAAYGNINDLYRSYATPATVIYTIDRLEYPGQESRSIKRDEFSENTGSESFSWRRLPSPRMVVKIDSAANDPSAADSLAGSALGVRIRLSQIDGLVSTQVVVGNKSIEKTVATEIALPISSSFKLSQKLDHKLRLTEVSATGLIEESAGSKINLVYSHASQAMRGELLFVRDKINYGVFAEANTPGSHGVLNRVSFGLNKGF